MRGRQLKSRIDWQIDFLKKTKNLTNFFIVVLNQKFSILKVMSKERLTHLILFFQVSNTRLRMKSFIQCAPF